MIDKEVVCRLVEEKLASSSYYLVDVTVAPGNVITVEIDNDEAVSIDDCAELSRYIEERLDRDVEDYELEVGSAGITSPFKVLRQYIKNIGNEVEIQLKNGPRVTGILKAEQKASQHMGILRENLEPTAQIFRLYRFGMSALRRMEPAFFITDVRNAFRKKSRIRPLFLYRAAGGIPPFVCQDRQVIARVQRFNDIVPALHRFSLPGAKILIVADVAEFMSGRVDQIRHLQQLAGIGVPAAPMRQVELLAKLAAGTGMRGLVCSPLELPCLRRELGGEIALVTPRSSVCGSASAAASSARRIISAPPSV